MKKFYQVVFGWKTPRAKKLTHCSSPFLHLSYELAKDYAEDILHFERTKHGLKQFRNVQLIYDYYIDELEVYDDFIKGGD